MALDEVLHHGDVQGLVERLETLPGRVVIARDDRGIAVANTGAAGVRDAIAPSHKG